MSNPCLTDKGCFPTLEQEQVRLLLWELIISQYSYMAKIYNPKSKPVYHIVQQFLNARFDKKECSRVAANLKYDVTGSVIGQALNDLFRVSPHYKELLWGNQFPRSINDLGEGNSYFFKSNSIFADIDWLYVQISKYHAEISKFVTIRDKVEQSILLGHYDAAHALLKDIHNEFGESIWYYEMKMLVYSYSGNEKLAFEMLSEVNRHKENSKHGFVPFLLSYLFKRCSKSYSAYAYDSELEDRFKLNRTDFQKDRYVYYLFRLNLYKSNVVDDLSPVLIMEATNSLIDRYQSVINILRLSFAYSDNNAIKTLYALYASKFYRKTNDRLLTPMVAYRNMNNLQPDYYNLRLINLLDDYYRGDYTSCIDKCKSYVVDDVPNFDIIKVYCRSLIALNKNYSQICTNAESILNQIAYYSFKIMTETEYEDNIRHLYQLNKNIYGLSFASGLSCFIESESNHKSNSIHSAVSLCNYDPLFCNYLEEDEAKYRYVQLGKEQFGSIGILDYVNDRINKTVSTNTYVNKYIRDIDAAVNSFNEGLYGDALDKWKDILADNRETLPIVQSAIEYIYRCYEELDKKQDAISLYVEHYLKGKAFVSHIDTKSLTTQLYKDKYKKGVKNGLDLQLFVFINENEEERKSAVLERFCLYHDVNQVSDLIPEIESTEKRDKLELYLYLLASDDILRHMPYVTSTKKMLDEQQIIAQYLSSLSDSKHLKQYVELQQEIIETMIVYQNVRKIDESKIFVNQGALFKYEYKEYESLYQQFKNQLALSGETNQYYIVNTLSSSEFKTEDPTLIHAPVRFTSKSFIDSACQVFSVLREKFLFSKFGLKTYLSTRIRHGVFEGVLRSGFDSLHLLLLTENNRYVPISYWGDKYGLLSSEQSELMRILGKFSSGVNYTIDQFKEDILQVKVSDNEPGLFDFRLSPDDMCYATVSAETRSNNFEEFCLLIMEYLLNMTNKNLVNVRHKLEEDLKNSFMRLVDTLEQDIQQFSKLHFYSDLKLAVMSARSEVNQKIAQVEKWFYLQDAKFDDFSLLRQMKVVWKVTSKMYPNNCPSIRIEGEEFDVKIKAAYIIHISDILTIFYNNMLSYSKSTDMNSFFVSLSQEDDIINLHFENDIKEDGDQLNAKFEDMLKSDSRLQVEGRSGLVKVRKIIKYDLGCEQNELSIKALDGKCIADVFVNKKEICV